MRRWLSTAILLTAAILATMLVGCQQLFTPSFGKALARTSIPLPSNLTDAQAADLAAQAKANQDTMLANALVANLVARIGTPSAATAGLQASAASAAVVASGLGSNLYALIADPSNVDLTALLATIQAGGSPNVVTALSYLDPAAGGLTAAQAAAAGIGPTDYAIAAFVIAASVLPPGDPSTLSGTTPGTPLYDFTHTTECILAQTLLTLATATPGPGTDLLNQLKLKFSL